MRLMSMTRWLTAPEPAVVRSMMQRVLRLAVPVALLSGTYGYLAASNRWFPTSFIDEAADGFTELKRMAGLELPWYYVEIGDQPALRVYKADRLSPGLTLITALGHENHPEARVVDSQGRTVHRWSINWFELWPDAKHLAPQDRFNALPGPHTHGVVLTREGDLIFSLERAGLFRLDACGRIKWKLPRMTHHSLFQDEDNNLWVPDVVPDSIHDPALPGYTGRTFDYHLLKVSPDGQILKQWRIFDLFVENRLASYLYVTSRANFEAKMSGDTLHLNDAEVFPRSMTPGTFKPGDVMISLRNINMVMIFDPQTNRVVHVFNGPFVRQHDPDFVDGNTITVFDNHTHTMGTSQERTRILEVSTDGRKPRVIFEGNARHPFFTNIMGKHQALPNGNMLLTEATKGRALEIDAEGNLVWELRNFVRPGVVGLMDEAQRLDPQMDAAFFARARAACGG